MWFEEVGQVRPSEVVGINIRRAREAKGLSLRELGAALEGYLDPGWASQSAWAAEQGGRRFAAEELMALSAVLDRPPSWFLTPEDPGTVIEFSARREEAWTTLVPARVLGAEQEQLATSLEAMLAGLDAVRRSAVVSLAEIDSLAQAGQWLLEALTDPGDANGSSADASAIVNEEDKK